MSKTLMMKLIAVILVLMLSLSNFLVLVSYAAEISSESSIDLEKQNAETNNKNIEFNSYFLQNGAKRYDAILNIADANKVYLSIKLSNSGYLKTGVVNFEEESLNIKKQEETASTIQNIDYEKNEITLNQINSGTEIELEIPIEIAKNEIFNIQNLNKNNKVLFTGTYVTEKGKEIEIEKEIILNLQWNADVEGVLEQSISKYSNILPDETLIELKLSSSLDKNIMPLKETIVELEVPEIEGKLPKYVNVIADSLISTTGESNENNFGKDNFEYIETEKKIKINVQNLINENNEVSWKNGLDEYRFILIYDKLIADEKNIALNTKASFDVYGKTERVEKKVSTEVILNENIGNINEVILSTDTTNIYKSFMYANSEYETEYTLSWNLNVGYARVSDKIVISDENENFINNNQEKIDTNKNTYYKQTIISKKNFEEILGKEGYIKISNELNEELATIKLDMTEDENIVINYQDSDLSKIKIETSKPQTEGTLEIRHTKAIKAKTEYQKEVIKTFVKLENEINLNTTYNKIIEDVKDQVNEENNSKTEEIEITNINALNTINLVEPETKVEINVNKDSLVTGSVNEDVEIYVNLINNKEEFSLFNNSIIDISLPTEIDYLKLKDAKLVFEEELTIANKELYEAEDGTKHIRIILEGTQTKYNIGNIITGANLIIITDMSLKDMDESKDSEIQVVCTNEDIGANAKTNINLVKIEVPEVEEEQEIEQEQNPEEEQEENIPKQTPEIEQDEENKESEPEQEENQENEEEILEQEENTTEKVEENYLNADVNIKSDKENMELKWGEIVTYRVTIKNYGTTLKNSNLIIELPEGLSYMAEEEAFEPIFYEEKPEVKTINWNLEEVLTGRETTKEFKAIVNRNASSIIVNAKLTDNNTGKFAISNNVINNCKQGNVSVQLATRTYSMQIAEEDIFEYEIKIKEILGSKLNNVKLELEIPNGINYIQGYIVENDEFLTNNVKIDNKTVTINIPELLENEEKYIVIELNANNIKENSDKEIVAKAKVNADGMEECVSNEVRCALSKPILEVKHYTNLENNKASTGNIITHYIEVKNVGTGIAEDLEIVDNYSKGIEYVGTSYLKNNQIKELDNYAGNKSRIITSLNENETIIMAVSTEALGNSNIENFVTVSAKGIETITTDKTTYNITDVEDGSNNSSEDNSNNDEEKRKSNLSGYVWLDTNKNGINESDESRTGNIEIWLINKDTNSQISANTSSNGEYKFENIENGSYMLVFVYDTTKYSLTKSFAEYINEDLISKGVRAEAQINNERKVVAVIENIIVQNGDVSNLNIGLIENEIFDLSLDKVVDNITVTTKKDTSTYNANKKFAKLEIHSKEIDGAKVKITYRFDISNEGDIQGSAKRIVENIPKELTINLDANPGWKIDEEGRIYNDSLSNVIIGAGETKSIYLTLEKNMTEDNTGIINNIAEIEETYNVMHIKDHDSIEGNSKQNEDDISYADVYIGIKTGRTILYISLALSMFIVLSTGIYLINKKVLQY